jgi:hypothetical protein
MGDQCPQLAEGDIRGLDGCSRFDPKETWAAQDFRSAKSSFVRALKRDIVSAIAWT